MTRSPALLGLACLLTSGCAPDPFTADAGPVTARVAGAFDCPVTDSETYDPGPAELSWIEAPDDLDPALHVQGCFARHLAAERGPVLAVRIIQHLRFDRAWVLELAVPDALLDGEQELRRGGVVAVYGPGAFGSLSLVEADTPPVVRQRVVGGTLRIEEADERALGCFDDLRLGDP